MLDETPCIWQFVCDDDDNLLGCITSCGQWYVINNNFVPKYCPWCGRVVVA